MSAGSNGLPDPSTTRTFIDDSDNPYPVDIETDPVSKDLFFVNIGEGTVNRISYASSNRAPVAAASASPRSGVAPLRVQLSAAGSSDPDGDSLTYSWDTDGNGSFGDATGRTPTVTYSTGGTFAARVLVTDPGGLSDTSDPVTITVTTVDGPVNSAPPTVSGSPRIGASLSSSTGTWTGDAPITYARQWQRCTLGPVTSCADITGARSATYAPQLADENTNLRVRVTATNAGGSASAASAVVGPVTADTANTPPVPVITAPTASARWKAGDTITFAGRARDAQDGAEPASRLSWDIVLGHCTTLGCHQHPLATRTGVAGGTIAGPDHQAPSYIQLTLTATDAVGATTSVTRRIDPHTVDLKIHSNPSGLAVAAGAEQSPPTPFRQSWVVNSQVQLTAPATQTTGGITYTFKRWSDGKAATHTLDAPATDTTYTATYTGTCRATTYSAAVLADAPAVYWRLGESTGTTAADTSGRSQTGTYGARRVTGPPGPLNGDANRALSLGGGDDAVVRPVTNGIGGAAASVELWLETPKATTDGEILSYATSNAPAALQIANPRDLVVAVQGQTVATGVALNDGRWHHLAVTWASAGGVLRVYKDGALAFTGSAAPGATIASGGALAVGLDRGWPVGGSEAENDFVGQVDEVAVYPTALTQGRVQSHRYAGVLADCPASLTALSVRTRSRGVRPAGFCPLAASELAGPRAPRVLRSTA